MYKQVVLLAAGRGSRLDRINTPKALVPVGGTPISLGTLQQFERTGVERALIVVGHRRDEVTQGLAGRTTRLKLEFVVNHDWERGLVGSLLAAAPHLRGSFIVEMADHIFDARTVEHLASRGAQDPWAMAVDRHLDQVFDLPSAVKVATVASMTGSRLRACSRDLGPFDAVDAGLFTASPELFEIARRVIQQDPDADLCDVLTSAAQSRSIQTLQVHGPWHDIDTPAARVRAEMATRTQQCQATLEAFAQPAHPQEDSVHRYTFHTGAPVETQIQIQRGAVANLAAVELIDPQRASSPIFVITDDTVDALYGDAAVSGLRRRGHSVERIVMAEGEASKSLANYVELVERIPDLSIAKNSTLVSLGGGAVCNVAGFLASTLYRGVELIHIPTTLMAQADAAISHKQGINGSRGKNLIGAYYAPSKIVVDVDVLQTLRPEQIRDGLAEVIKHALAQDPAYLEGLLQHTGESFDALFLEWVVRRNIELKCELIALDPKETREGMILQYGHTVGHPIEYLSGYRMTHGKAVAVGMVVAARVAAALGACTDAAVDTHLRVLGKYGLPTHVPESIATDDIMEAMKFNKTYLQEGTRMALTCAPGVLWSVDGQYAIPVPDQVLREAVDSARKVPPPVHAPAPVLVSSWQESPSSRA